MQALEEAREAGGKWEAQCQEALGQLEALKDLLEESALWQSSTHAVPPSINSPHAAASNSSNLIAQERPAANGDAAQARANTAADGSRSPDGADTAVHLQLEQRFMQVRLPEDVTLIAHCRRQAIWHACHDASCRR